MEDNFFVFTRFVKDRVHPKTIFTIDIFPGIQAEFGEMKSKLYINCLQLTQLKINQDQYSKILAEDFWKLFYVKYISSKMKNKKLPQKIFVFFSCL